MLATPPFPATIVAAALPLIADAMCSAGLDAPRAFRETGLPLQSPLQPGAAIPLDAFADLLQQAGRQSDDVTRLWQCGAGIAGPALDRLFPTGLREHRLGALIDRLLEDLAHLQEGTVFRRTIAGDTCILTYRINDPSIWPRSRDAEFTLGFLDAVLRRFARNAPHLVALGFEHERGGVAQADIAGECGLSVRSLRRQLDARGQSFRSLLERARLTYALWALTETGLPIGEIAHRLGYDGQSAFARAFKRRTGAPPSRYRRSNDGGGAPLGVVPASEPGPESPGRTA